MIGGSLGGSTSIIGAEGSGGSDPGREVSGTSPLGNSMPESAMVDVPNLKLLILVSSVNLQTKTLTVLATVNPISFRDCYSLNAV
jgi:hypothetical protein